MPSTLRVVHLPRSHSADRRLANTAKTTRGGEAVLKNLAEQLLSAEECRIFKQALQHFRVTRSVASLCTSLRPLISTTERLMLLVELSHHLPSEPLRRDFHKLCTLHFPKYHTFLRYFTPHSVSDDSSKGIGQDASGHLQVVRTRYENGVIVTETDVASASGRMRRTVEARAAHDHNTSGVRGDSYDVQHLGNGFLASSGQSTVSSRARSASPYYAMSSAESGSGTVHRAGAHSGAEWPNPGFLGAGQLKILSGSFQSLASRKNHGAEKDDRDGEGSPRHKRILLSRRSDGSLGVGIKGGKEYGTPIVVDVVEDGSQAQQQGLRMGDKIIDVNGKDFRNLTHVEAVSQMRNAWNIIMIVDPAGVDASQAATYSDVRRVDAAHQETEIHVYPGSHGRLGCAVSRDVMTGELVLVGVETESSASKAGLCKGDVILQIDGMDVTSLTEKQIATLTNAKHVRLTVKRADPTKTGTTRKGRESLFSDDVFSPLDFSSPAQQSDLFFASSSPRFSGRSRSEERMLSPRSLFSSRGTQHDAWPKPETRLDVHGFPETHDDDASRQRVYLPRSYATSSLAAGGVHSARSDGGGARSTVTRGRPATRQPHPEGHRYTLVYSPRGPSEEADPSSETRRLQQAFATSTATSASRASKARYARNRSRSQESVSQAPTDSDLLLAVQSGVEKRQRALRLSMHQVPDDNDDWKV